MVPVKKIISPGFCLGGGMMAHWFINALRRGTGQVVTPLAVYTQQTKPEQSKEVDGRRFYIG